MKRSFVRLVGALREEGKLGEFVPWCLSSVPFDERRARRPIFIMSESGSGSTWIAAMLGHLPTHVYIHELKMIREDGFFGAVCRLLSDQAWATNGRMLFVLFESFQRARLWTLRSHAQHLKTRSELLAPDNLGPFDPDAPRRTQAGIDTINSTGSNIRIAPLLRRAYPNAVLVYLVRDPRDTVASVRYRKPFGRDATVEEWANAYRDRWEAFKRYRDRAQIDLIKYEDWLMDAERELRAFLARHSLSLSDDSISNAVFKHSADAIRAGRTKAVGNLGQAKTGKWRETLTSDEVRRIWPILKEVTHELGYAEQASW